MWREQMKELPTRAGACSNRDMAQTGAAWLSLETVYRSGTGNIIFDEKRSTRTRFVFLGTVPEPFVPADKERHAATPSHITSHTRVLPDETLCSA